MMKYLLLTSIIAISLSACATNPKTNVLHGSQAQSHHHKHHHDHHKHHHDHHKHHAQHNPQALQRHWQIVKTTPSVAIAPNNHLSFADDGRGFVYAGCNQMLFSYVVNKQELRLNKLTSTRMACQQMALEDFIGNHFGNISQYDIKDGKLVLMGDGVRITAIPAKDKSDAD